MLRPNLGRRISAGRRRPSDLAKRLALGANEADRKGFRALAVEGGADRAVLGPPHRGVAGQRRILSHLMLERETLLRLEALVHIGVQVGDAPGMATGPDLAAGVQARVVRVEGTTLVVEAV